MKGFKIRENPYRDPCFVAFYGDDGLDIHTKSSRRTFRELILRVESVWNSI